MGEDTVAVPVLEPKKGIYVYSVQSIHFCALPDRLTDSNLLMERYFVRAPALPELPSLQVNFFNDRSEPVIAGALASTKKLAPAKYRNIKCVRAQDETAKKILFSELENRILRIKQKFDEEGATRSGRIKTEKFDFPLIACRGIKGKVGRLAKAQLDQIRIAKSRAPAGSIR